MQIVCDNRQNKFYDTSNEAVWSQREYFSTIEDFCIRAFFHKSKYWDVFANKTLKRVYGPNHTKTANNDKNK